MTKRKPIAKAIIPAFIESWPKSGPTVLSSMIFNGAGKAPDLSKQLIVDTFADEDGDINPYYPKFKSHQLVLEEIDLNFKVSFSKQGLIALKTSSQNQAIEIVRRRIDEVGTNEPNILKRGNNRILVELPGLDDPTRIKALLGKTANLTFRFVTNNDNDSFGVEKLKLTV